MTALNLMHTSHSDSSGRSMKENSQTLSPNNGRRILLSVIDERARLEPSCPWVSVPRDDADLSKGFRDITFSQFSNAVNHASHWLDKNLPASTEPFQSFAYSAPKDLRYPILAVAAGKCRRVMIVPSSIITPKAIENILVATKCKIYIRDDSMRAITNEVAQSMPDLKQIVAPELDELLQDEKAEVKMYKQSWDTAKDDPWLVFHTSGTTGLPKPITYTHRMMARMDAVASVKEIWETRISLYAGKRWYTPLPALHYVGMSMITAVSGFFRNVVVLGPTSLPPSPHLVEDVLKYGRIDGCLLPPTLIDALCLSPSGLSSLRNLKYLHYCGAPLGPENGNKLAPYIGLAPAIGSTEAGGYLTTIPSGSESWQYVSFHPSMGARFERKFDNLHELVFVRTPDHDDKQQIFQLYPDRTTFATNDLWLEHPTQKGLWKLVGRADDYVYLTHGEGLHASTLESEIERHELVQSALIGGHAHPKPVVLIELIPDAQARLGSTVTRKALLNSLAPYFQRANAHCDESVQLSTDLTIFATSDRPFARTSKDSIARLQSLRLYEKDIQSFFED